MSKNLRLRDNAALAALLKDSHARVRHSASARAASGGAPASEQRLQKFNAKRTQVDGISFDSKHEAERFALLKMRAHAGEIRNLRCHVPIAIEVNGVHVTTLEVDFVYDEIEHHKIPDPRRRGDWATRTKYEDAKGYKRGSQYEMFKLKAALLKATRGITVEVV